MEYMVPKHRDELAGVQESEVAMLAQRLDIQKHKRETIPQFR
jgi:hypothetical protein